MITSKIEDASIAVIRSTSSSCFHERSQCRFSLSSFHPLPPRERSQCRFSGVAEKPVFLLEVERKSTFTYELVATSTKSTCSRYAE